jgi:putative IMPACT (imprinted ancient) family translation regulator
VDVFWIGGALLQLALWKAIIQEQYIKVVHVVNNVQAVVAIAYTVDVEYAQLKKLNNVLCLWVEINITIQTDGRKQYILQVIKLQEIQLNKIEKDKNHN